MTLLPSARAQLEREYWADQARRDPQAAVWGEPGWREGVEHCLGHLGAVTLAVTERPGEWAFDLGCGVGRLLTPLARNHPDTQWLGVDIEPAMLAEVEPAWNVTLFPTDGRHLVVPCDCVAGYSVLLFQHLTDDGVREYVRQVGDRLRNLGGVFVCQFVTHAEAGPFSHARAPGWMLDCLLLIGGFARAHIELDETHDEWAWATAWMRWP